MLRPALALTLLALFGGAAFGLRTLTQIRRYGDSGWRFSRPDGPAVVSHVLLATGIILLVAAPVAALAAGAAHRPLGWADLGQGDGAPGVAGAVVGAALATAGAVVTLVAQRNMGASWRIGVAPEERTSLITGGLFRHIRNPIFSGMGMFAAGEALLVPNSLSLLALVLSVAGLQHQVRQVEEPYLVATHGRRYRTWAAQRGRFLPGIGRGIG